MFGFQVESRLSHFASRPQTVLSIFFAILLTEERDKSMITDRPRRELSGPPLLPKTGRW